MQNDSGLSSQIPHLSQTEERSSDQSIKTSFVFVLGYLSLQVPPKDGVIALWPNTRVVKCKYCASQKRNEANDKSQ